MLFSGVCGQHRDPDNPYLGNMHDFSYSGQVTPEGITARINALGEKVSITKFKGQFVWADYAAPWCHPCESQARVIKELEGAFGNDVVFLTVITSTAPKYNSSATQKTAKDWANRFQLNPQYVLAASLWYMRVPTHILFSPTGQTLYRAEGYMSKDQINAILSAYIYDWKNWTEHNYKAKWMRFNK